MFACLYLFFVNSQIVGNECKYTLVFQFFHSIFWNVIMLAYWVLHLITLYFCFQI